MSRGCSELPGPIVSGTMKGQNLPQRRFTTNCFSFLSVVLITQNYSERNQTKICMIEHESWRLTDDEIDQRCGELWICMYFIYVFYVCMYVCMYVCVHVCVYYMCVWIYVFTVCTWCMYVCMYVLDVCMYVCTWCMYVLDVCMYALDVCMYLMYVCMYLMYVCMCVCMYEWMYVCTSSEDILFYPKIAWYQPIKYVCYVQRPITKAILPKNISFFNCQRQICVWQFT